MKSEEYRIIHVEDSMDDAELVHLVLVNSGIRARIEVVQTAATLQHALGSPVDLILCDFTMPGYSGLEALQLCRITKPEIPFIFVSGTVGEDVAVQALKAGAWDYLLKDRLSRLPNAIHSALRLAEERHNTFRLQQELSERANLLDLSQDLICVTAPDGSISYCNRAAREAFQLGSDTLHSITQLPVELNWVQLTDAVLARGRWSGEVSLPRPGQPARILDAVALPAPGSKIFFVGRDISDRKLLEEKFLRAQRLESVGALTSGIAHDLNNVLTPINLATQLLRDLVGKSLETTELLDTIESSTSGATDLIRQLLQFGKGFSFRHKMMKPEEILQETAKIARRTFPRHITIETFISAPHQDIEADPTHLHQILLNLLVNARDVLTNPGGQILLSLTSERFSSPPASILGNFRPGEYLVLTVKDNGPGISEEKIPRIFEPFFTTKPEGTGLGLCTVLRLVRSSSGFLRVLTDRGQGAEFKCCFPLLRPASEPETHLPEPAPEEETGNVILLIDDEKSITEVTRLLLRTQGYHTLTANSADQSREFLDQLPNLSLVICDIAMPECDGFKLMREFLRLQPDLRILFCSGAAQELPADFNPSRVRFIQKPWDMQTFLKVVKAALSQPHTVLGSPA